MVFSVSNIRPLKFATINKPQKKAIPSFKKMSKKTSQEASSKKDSIFAIAKKKESSSKKKKLSLETAPSFSPTEMGLPPLPPSSKIDFEGSLPFLSSPVEINDQILTQMTDYIVAESQKEGVSHIEVVLSSEHFSSPIHETKILIDHFDTDPHSFNLRILNPSAQTLEQMQNQLTSLVSALNHSLPHFKIHLLPPAHVPLTFSFRERENQKRKNGKKIIPKKIPS